MGQIIYVVGIGPGAYEQMTIQAARALENSDTIIGYTVYVDLVKEHFPEKRFLTTPMRGEAERCRMACEEAAAGHKVSLVCSGDAGVYGLAGLMLKEAEGYPGVEVRVISGVTAALSGAALLGAPLIHDFCVISLSDLLTPKEKIIRRLQAAAEADFVIVIYNPSSRKRADYLQKACEILLEYRSGKTVCGIAGNIGREGEYTKILTLEELKDSHTDMFSTVFIGNSQTYRSEEHMITPRGYRDV